MATTQIQSVAGPFASRGEAATLAARLLAMADLLDLLPEDRGDIDRLDADLMRSVLGSLARAGVATQARLRLGPDADGAAWERVLGAVREQVELSPMPQREWAPLLRVLGEQRLADLLGLSASSVRRYATEARRTPASVAAGLHWLALVVAALGGGYNDYGIQRWFDRSRSALAGRCPAEVLAGGFDVDGEEAAAVRDLAEALLASNVA